ncbi:MAG: hypothetical protein JWM10_3495 [Myxococcaceae bacterium]|nr:hypothetical protein [Myxococcaceae bacterium]
MNHRTAFTIALLTVGCGELAEVPSAGDAEAAPDATADVAAVSCPAGRSACGGACFDLRSDPVRCGACNWPCPPFYACNAGRCVARCDASACALNHVRVPECRSGECAVGECAPGYGDCNGVAADGCETRINGNDPAHCGACGSRCDAPRAATACVGGACALVTCAAGYADCDGLVASGCEVRVADDVLNCGACGSRCGNAHATPACVAGACALLSCNPSYANCDGAIGNGCEADLSSVSHCGGCGIVCPAPAHATPRCTTSACGYECDPGFVREGAGCRAWPRPVAPLSTSTVTSHRPTLRWALAEGDGARVELCRDRALTAGCVRPDVEGTSFRPAADLAPGEWFWRLTLRDGGVTSIASGPTWQFTVGARSTAVDSAWGATPDYNADGYADVVVDDVFDSEIRVFAGSADRPVLYSTLGVGSAGTERPNASWILGIGDVNGDGRWDFAESVNRGIYVHSGGEAVGAEPRFIPTGARSERFVVGVGDVNGDGYADLLADAGGGATALYQGGRGGLPTSPTAVIPEPDGPAVGSTTIAALGDVNGDGFADVALGPGSAESPARLTYLYLGGPAGLRPSSSYRCSGAATTGCNVRVEALGDVNGDGYADVGVRSTGPRFDQLSIDVSFGGATGPTRSPAAFGTTDTSTHQIVGAIDRAGDVDGDGYDDILLSRGAGLALHRGSATGTEATSTALLTFSRAYAGATRGCTGRGLGDIDGDHFGDIAMICAYRTDYFPSSPEVLAFSVTVYRGGVGGLSWERSAELSLAPASYWGLSVASRF